MNYLIVTNDKIKTITRDCNESIEHFLHRIELYKRAILDGITEEQAIMLSRCYGNIKKFGVTYDRNIKERIDELMEK